MAVLGADLLLEALCKIEDGTAVRIPQDNEKATYVKMIDKDMGKIDFTWPAVKIERLIRGLNPWPSAFTFLDGKTLKLWQASVEQLEASQKSNWAAVFGEVVEIRKDALVVMTGEGLLVITELQLEGKKRMMSDAFLRGYHVQLGTRLG
jgi:methionyl-tRNA formyltransferase